MNILEYHHKIQTFRRVRITSNFYLKSFPTFTSYQSLLSLNNLPWSSFDGEFQSVLYASASPITYFSITFPI